MKIVKMVLIGIVALIVFIFIALSAYKILYSQKVAESFEVNRPDLKDKVLIATQGSDFKNAIVAGIVENLKQKSLYIKVVDVSALPEIKSEEWKVIVLINTCEMSKLQPDVQQYLTRAKKLDNTLLLTTSGSGDWKPANSPIDTLTTASKKQNVNALVAQILGKLDVILGKV
jgi:menaquinone-dependent protoporphyrinogen IX oxidase